MLRAIVAIDQQRGLANDQGIPWQGKIPGDAQYFRDQTLYGEILMGFKTYQEFEQPLPARQNYVLSHDEAGLRPGFLAVTDLEKFVVAHPTAWIIGGAGLFKNSFAYLDELYITQLDCSYDCTRFFPEFHGAFTLASETEPITENAITYRFQIWQRTAHESHI